MHATQTNTGAKHGNYADRAGILLLHLLALCRLDRHCGVVVIDQIRGEENEFQSYCDLFNFRELTT
jgi:hypothetical protein